MNLSRLIRHILLMRDRETAPLSFFTWLAIILIAYRMITGVW
ncbi:MAG: hypothetical protein ACXVIY_03140 [Mucilaginibacter sp.]